MQVVTINKYRILDNNRDIGESIPGAPELLFSSEDAALQWIAAHEAVAELECGKLQIVRAAYAEFQIVDDGRPSRPVWYPHTLPGVVRGN